MSGPGHGHSNQDQVPPNLCGNTECDNTDSTYGDPQDRVHLTDNLHIQPDLYSLNNWGPQGLHDASLSSVALQQGHLATFSDNLPSSTSNQFYPDATAVPSSSNAYGSDNLSAGAALSFETLSHPGSIVSLQTQPGASMLFDDYFSNNPSYMGDDVDEEEFFSPSTEDNEEFEGDGAERSTLQKQEPNTTPPITDLKIHIETSPDVRRKRGRPRTKGLQTDPSSSTRNSKTQVQRTPHNEVERKYRLGLNAELERLRRTIPTLPQQDSNSLSGPPRPSKATVLASAVDYIKSVEKNVEELEAENKRLREMHAREAEERSPSPKSPRERK